MHYNKRTEMIKMVSIISHFDIDFVHSYEKLDISNDKKKSCN